MAEDVGELVVRVAMENSSFQQGVQNLQRSMKVVQSEFKNATSGLKDHGKGLDGLKAKQDMLGKSIETQSKLVQQYKNKLTESKDTLTKNAEAQEKLKTKVENAKKAYEESKKALGENDNKTKELKESQEKLSEQYAKGEDKIRNNVRAIDNWNIKANDAESKLKGMENDLGKTTKAIDKQSSAWYKLSQKLEPVGAKFKKVGDKMSSIGKDITTKVSVPIAAIGGLAIKAAADFEQGMSNIKAVTSASAGEMKQLNDLALKVGKDTAFSASEAAQGIEELAKAGLTTSQILNGGLKGAMDLAAAGGIEIKDAAEIASTALNAFKRDNISVVEAANLLAGAANASATDVGEMKFALAACSSVASAVGISFKDTSTSLAEFAQNGLKGSDAGTSLKTMLLNLQPKTDAQYKEFERLNLMTYDTTKAMQFLAKNGVKAAGNSFEQVDSKMRKFVATQTHTKEGTAKFNKAYKEMTSQLGISQSAFVDANGQFKSLSEVSEILKTHTSNLTDAQRLQALQTMFGTDAVRAATIMAKEGGKGFEDMYSAMAKVTAADTAAEKMNNFKGKVEQLKGSLETAGITLGNILLPKLKILVDRLTDITNKFLDLNPGAQKIILVGAGIVAAIGPVILVVGSLIAAVGRISAVFATASAAIAEAGGAMALITGPVGIAVASITGFITIFATLYATNKNFRDNVNTLWEQIKSIISTTFSVLKDLFMGFVSLISAIWSKFGGDITAIIKSSFGLVGAIVNTTLKGISDVIKIITSAIKGDWKGAWEGIKQLTVDLLNGIKNVFINSFNLIKNILQTNTKVFTSVFLGIPAKMLQIGKDIIQGLVNGITGAVGSVVKSIENIGSVIITKLKEKLGIHSPSRVMMELGKYVDLGLAQGIEDNKGIVEKQASDLAESALKEVSKVKDADIKLRLNVSESSINSKNSSMLTYGDKNKKAYQDYINFVNKLNQDEVKVAKELLDKDYKNRLDNLNNRKVAASNISSKLTSVEKVSMDKQIEHYRKIKSDASKEDKKHYAEKIKELKKYEQSHTKSIKDRSKAQSQALANAKKELKQHHDVAIQLLNKQSETIKKTFKANETAFKNTLNQYDEAIKRLSIDTKNLNKNLQNQQAIVIIQEKKIADLKKKYEELASAFGTTSKEAVDAKKAYEEASTALINMTNTVGETTAQITNKSIQDIDKLNDVLLKALRRKVEAERDAALETAKIKAKETNMSKEQLDSLMEYINKKYDKKLDNDRLQATAERLIVDKNQKAIISILRGYGNLYEDSGMTLGQRMVGGMKQWTDMVPSIVGDAMGKVETTVQHSANRVQGLLGNILSSISKVKNVLSGLGSSSDDKDDDSSRFDDIFSGWQSSWESNLNSESSNKAQTIADKYKDAFNRIELAQIELGRETKNTDEEFKKQQQTLDLQKEKLSILKKQYDEMRSSLGTEADEVQQLRKELASLNIEIDNNTQKLATDNIKNYAQKKYEAIELAILKLQRETKNYNEELKLQEDIFMQNVIKLNTMKAEYESLVKVLGKGADEVKKLQNDIISFENELNSTASKVKSDVISNINEFNNKIKEALKERYTEELRLQEEKTNRELENLNKWKDESIKMIEEVYNARIKSLDDEVKQEDRAEKDKAELRKINNLEETMKYEHNEFNKAEMQKELNNITKEREQRLHKEKIDDQKESLEQQKQNEINNINNIFQNNKKNLEKTLEFTKEFYKKKLEIANLDAEAQKLIVEKNQKEILELIKSYDKDYESAGKTLGQKFADSMGFQIRPVLDMIASIEDRISNIRTAEIEGALNSVKYASISSIPSSVNNSSTTNNSSNQVTNNNNFNFNNPKTLTPSEQRRQYETTLRKFNFSTP